MARVTQKTIAQNLGVSSMTVSKALRGSSEISESMRERILEEARRQRYVPNLLARDLLRQRTKIVGCLFPDLRYGEVHAVVSGIKSVLDPAGFSVIIGMTCWELEQEKREVEIMLGRQVEGLICGPQAGNEAVFREFVKYGLPLVFVGNCLDVKEASWVGMDGRDAVTKLMEHLFLLGHRRIALILPEDAEDFASEKPRVEAYCEALKTYGLPFSKELLGYSPPGQEVGFADKAEELMNLSEPPTAIIGLSDVIAYSAMDRLMSLGYQIPNDVAVAGIGDFQMSGSEMISLTTVAEHSYEAGRLAGQCFLDSLDNSNAKPMRQALRGTLIERRSTCGPITSEGELS